MSDVKNSDEKKKKKGLRIVLIIAFILFGISTVIVVTEQIRYSQLSEEEKIEYNKKIEQAAAEKELNEIIAADNSSMAYTTAKKHIEKYLKSPTTAKFPNRDQVKIIKASDVYNVYGYVDSQNSFGAMIRTKYRIALQQISKDDVYDSNKGWKILSFTTE